MKHCEPPNSHVFEWRGKYAEFPSWPGLVFLVLVCGNCKLSALKPMGRRVNGRPY